MNRSVAVGIAALLLTGALLWWWASRDAQVTAAVDPQTAVPVAEEEPFEPDEPEDAGGALVAAPAPPASPQPAPAEPPTPSTAVAPAPPPPEQITPPPATQLGPVARLKYAFDHDPVDSGAGAYEERIAAVFGEGHNKAPIAMLLKTTCHLRACKVELRWTPDQPYGFVAAGTLLGTNVNHDIAADPVGPQPDAQGARRIDIYIARDGYEPEDFDEVPGEVQE